MRNIAFIWLHNPRTVRHKAYKELILLNFSIFLDFSWFFKNLFVIVENLLMIVVSNSQGVQIRQENCCEEFEPQPL